MISVLVILIFTTTLTGCLLSENIDNTVDDNTAETTENTEASDQLIDKLGDKMEGKLLVETGEEEIDGEVCKTFALGTDTPEKFTAEEHYAVTPKGDIIYYMNIIQGPDWVPYVPES
jgi:hypothetical protein